MQSTQNFSFIFSFIIFSSGFPVHWQLDHPHVVSLIPKLSLLLQFRHIMIDATTSYPSLDLLIKLFQLCSEIIFAVRFICNMATNIDKSLLHKKLHKSSKKISQ